MANNTDLILLSSFLQNEQVEKNNATLRNIHDLLRGASSDNSILTKNLELSVSELKEAQLTNLKTLWSNTAFPSQTISHMVRIHSAYTDELIMQENLRLIQCAEFIKQEKNNANTPSDVNAESLGLNTSRRPPLKAPSHPHQNGIRGKLWDRPSNRKTKKSAPSLSHTRHKPQRNPRYFGISPKYQAGRPSALHRVYFEKGSTFRFR